MPSPLLLSHAGVKTRPFRAACSAARISRLPAISLSYRLSIGAAAKRRAEGRGVLLIRLGPTKTSPVPSTSRTVDGAATDAAAILGCTAASRAAATLAEGVHRGFQGVRPDDVALCLDLERFPFAVVAAW
jgi:hypothetical protein